MDHRCAIRKAEETAMNKQPSGREDYVRKVLEAYRNTPGTCGNLRRPDRMLAVQLYQRGVPLSIVENALVLAAVRRLIRPADAPPLTTVRSMAYYAVSEIMPSCCVSRLQAALWVSVKPA
jgi:hypothetical protein